MSSFDAVLRIPRAGGRCGALHCWLETDSVPTQSARQTAEDTRIFIISPHLLNVFLKL